MRLGILDIGSNTVHLLAADARPGGRPLATTSDRSIVRLMQYLTPEGAISEEGVRALVDAVTRARRTAETERVETLLATATSAVREALNGEEVIARIEGALGQPLQVLTGEEEAELTFLAVRRWFGWDAGRILLLDIGGGSFEFGAGGDELPEVAASVPLGAGRMTVQFLPGDPPGEDAVELLRAHAREVLAPVTAKLNALPAPDHLVGSSKAIRSLANLAGREVSGSRLRPHGDVAFGAEVVDSATGADSGIRSSGAAGDHPRPHPADRRGRRLPAHRDEDARYR